MQFCGKFVCYDCCDDDQIFFPNIEKRIKFLRVIRVLCNIIAHFEG